MSYVNSTEFYNIPLFEETDLYNPMDYNDAMEAVDTALHGAVVDAENAVATAGTASDVATAAASAVEILSGEVAEANGKITALQTNVVNLDNKVDDIKDDALDMICAFVEPTAQVGDDPESTHNYSIGDYFRYNDVLYRATAAIHIGDTIIPNTNCVATNVSTELIALASGGVVSVDADDVNYNNTSSGLTATNVQDAIDELSNTSENPLVLIAENSGSSTQTVDISGYKSVAIGRRSASGQVKNIRNICVCEDIDAFVTAGITGIGSYLAEGSESLLTLNNLTDATLSGGSLLFGRLR